MVKRRQKLSLPSRHCSHWRQLCPGERRTRQPGWTRWQSSPVGFHRYSVDARWFVPHFEKMLYDQAQLAVSYVEAFQITGDASYSQTARGIQSEEHTSELQSLRHLVCR